VRLVLALPAPESASPAEAPTADVSAARQCAHPLPGSDGLPSSHLTPRPTRNAGHRYNVKPGTRCYQPNRTRVARPAAQVTPYAQTETNSGCQEGA
jgi:hypothetical protein